MMTVWVRWGDKRFSTTLVVAMNNHGLTSAVVTREPGGHRIPSLASSNCVDVAALLRTGPIVDNRAQIASKPVVQHGHRPGTVPPISG